MPVQTLTGRITPVARLIRLLKNDRREIFHIFLYAIFSGLIQLSLPLGIQAILNLIQGGQVSTSWIILVIFVTAGIALSGILNIVQLRISEIIQQRIFARAAFEFALRLPRLKYQVSDRKYVPEIVNRFFDTVSVQRGLSKVLIDISSAGLQLFFGLVLLSLYHPFFILFGLVLLLLLVLIFSLTGRAGLSTSLEESSYKYQVAFWLQELGRNLSTFKLSGPSNLHVARTNELVGGYLSGRRRHFRVLVVQFLSLVGFKVMVAAGLLVLGSLLVIHQQLNIGQFVAAEIIILLVIGAAEKLVLSMENIYDLLTSLEKLGSVSDLELEEEHEGFPLPEANASSGMKVELRNLSFQFPDSAKAVLNNLNLIVKPGDKICISGTNASGKSTLLKLLAGLYSPASGTLLFDDLPASNLNPHQLRNQTGEGFYREHIFSGSLVENITLGRENINLENLHWAVEQTGLSSWIASLPKGYETLLEPFGQRLPGSVVSRILLARAIVHQPRLLLIGEEVLEGLPDKVISGILDFLIAPTNSWTLILVSNRNVVQNKFSRVLEMTEGTIHSDSNSK